MYEFIQYDVFAGNLDIIYCSYYFAGCNVTVSVGLGSYTAAGMT